MVDPFFPDPPLRMDPRYSVMNVYNWAENTDKTTTIFHPIPIKGNLTVGNRWRDNLDFTFVFCYNVTRT